MNPRWTRGVAAPLLAMLFVAGGCGSATESLSPSATSLGTTTNSIATTTSAAQTHTVSDALALIKRVYDPYAGASIDTILLGNCFWPESGRPCPGALTRYMTADLVERLTMASHEGTGIDPVICAQNVPGEVSYATPEASNGIATIVVRAGWEGQPEEHQIRLTVDLVSLKITDLVCSTPLGE